MSIERKEKFICPNCGAEVEATVWQSLNADIDPKAKDALIEGKLFGAECPKCHRHHNLVYPILYHDMTHKVMVEFNLDHDVEDSIKEFKEAQAAVDNSLQDMMHDEYRHRFVKTQNDLQEKAMIFDADLDDRVVEIMKLFVMKKIKNDRPDAKVQELHFYVSDKGHGFAAICEDNSFTIDASLDFYSSIKERYGEKLNEVGDKDYLVDHDWVVNRILK